MAHVTKKSTPYQTAHKVHRESESFNVVYQDWSGYGSSDEIEESKEGGYKIRSSETSRKDTFGK